MVHPRALRACGLVMSCGTALALVVSCLPAAAPGADPEIAPVETPPASATEAGSACVSDFGCSADGMAFLRCDGEKMVVHGLCRGPRHCRADERGVACDQSIAEIGDACDGGGAACSLDGINLLVCRDGQRKLKSACTTGCEVQRKMGLVSCHGADITP